MFSQFPFRHAEDRFDNGKDRFAEKRNWRLLAPFVTGLGIADDLLSLMVFTHPSAVRAAGQELLFKLPLCEDM